MGKARVFSATPYKTQSACSSDRAIDHTSSIVSTDKNSNVCTSRRSSCVRKSTRSEFLVSFLWRRTDADYSCGFDPFSSITMAQRRPVCFLGVFMILVAVLCDRVKAEVFTNTFLVKMREPAERHVADSVAARNGFVNLGPVSKTIKIN